MPFNPSSSPFLASLRCRVVMGWKSQGYVSELNGCLPISHDVYTCIQLLLITCTPTSLSLISNKIHNPGQIQWMPIVDHKYNIVVMRTTHPPTNVHICGLQQEHGNVQARVKHRDTHETCGQGTMSPHITKLEKTYAIYP
jgi:hypothetical protein